MSDSVLSGTLVCTQSVSARRLFRYMYIHTHASDFLVRLVMVLKICVLLKYNKYSSFLHKTVVVGSLLI